MDRQRLEKWIENNSRVTLIKVRHVSAIGKFDGEVCSIPIRDGETLIAPGIAAEQILAACNDDAAGIGGVQTYAVQGFIDDKPVARVTVRVQSESDSIEDEGIATEPATKSGLLGQLMRHNELLSRSLVSCQDSMFRALTRAMEQMSVQNERMRDKHMQQVELTESLLSEQHERDLASVESQARVENISRTAQTIQQYLPVVVSHFLHNKKAGNQEPETASANASSVQKLGKSLMSDPDRMGRIMAELTPEEQAAIMELMQQQGD
jgi:hypothetical protein